MYLNRLLKSLKYYFDLPLLLRSMSDLTMKNEIAQIMDVEVLNNPKQCFSTIDNLDVIILCWDWGMG